jgi:hypothetical protein
VEHYGTILIAQAIIECKYKVQDAHFVAKETWQLLLFFFIVQQMQHKL